MLPLELLPLEPLPLELLPPEVLLVVEAPDELESEDPELLPLLAGLAPLEELAPLELPLPFPGVVLVPQAAPSATRQNTIGVLMVRSPPVQWVEGPEKGYSGKARMQLPWHRVGDRKVGGAQPVLALVSRLPEAPG